MPTHADIVIPTARLAITYADMLCKDIPADRFGHVPEGVVCNSPSYNIGHLALYADMAAAMLECPDARNDPDWQAKYAFGAVSKHDPDQSIYGSKDELIARFVDRQTGAINAFARASEELLGRPNPREKMRDRFPTIGAMATFMITGHPMGHLGQISTWRRCMGLPMIF